jgi:branched-chain amino acid transport system ATP-binding protein
VDDIRKINKDMGITILLIEHDMKVVMNLCEYIYAMASGKVISEGDTNKIQNDPEVIRAYLGGVEESA